MGPDFKKAFLKKNSDRIPSDEEVRQVVFGEAKGGAWRRGIAAGTGGLVGAVADQVGSKKHDKMRAEIESQGDSDAAAWPAASPYWVVLTDKHMRVFEGQVGSKKVGKSTYYSLDRIADLDFDKKMLISKLGVVFTDGSRIDLDVGKQKIKPFLEDFANLRSGM